MNAPARPVLRYHGGKWKLAPWIIAHLPPHRVYCEPYGGAASVLLRKPRSEAEVYNDLDGEVVHLFRVLRDRQLAVQLAEALRLTPFARAEFFAAYEPSDDPVERARRLVVRSYMAFGTTARRKNRTGFRAVPWRSGGATAVDDWIRYPDTLPAFVERLRGVLIENRPALEVIAQQDAADAVFYVDPPYPIGVRSAVRSPSDNDKAYAHNLTDDQHRDLASALRAAAGYVVVSGYACEIYDRELFADWHRVTRETTADGAIRRTEVLWLSPRTADALSRQQSLTFTPTTTETP